MTGEGLKRTLDAVEVAAWAEVAVAEAECRAPSFVASAFVHGFGMAGEVAWADPCCRELGPDCRPGQFTYYHERRRVTRDELCGLLVEAMLAANREVEAAMVRDA